MDSFDSFKHAVKMFLALVKKLYIFNNFEIVHVSSCSGLNMVTSDIVILT